MALEELSGEFGSSSFVIKALPSPKFTPVVVEASSSKNF
jgi:hypothetical protein